MSRYAQIDTANLPWFRCILTSLLPALCRVTRACWWAIPVSKTSFHERSLAWKVLWAAARTVGALPGNVHSTLICNLGGGVRMALDLSRLTDCLALCFGPGEHDVFATIRQFCERSGVMVDVGANIGSVTIPAAKYLSGGRVISFEPSAEMRSSLERNLRLSGVSNVDIVPVALADKPGDARLVVVQLGNPGSAYLDYDLGNEESTVKVLTLTEALPDLTRLDFIKLDVEGAEVSVIEGGRAVLRRFQPIIMAEINRKQLRHFGSSGEQLLLLLEELGYECYLRDRRLLRSLRPSDLDTDLTFNVIAIPRGAGLQPAQIPKLYRWLPNPASMVSCNAGSHTGSPPCVR